MAAYNEITVRRVPDEYGSSLLRVECGDRWEDHLDDGEALWCIVRFLCGEIPPPYLRTQEQHDAWEAKYNPKPLEPWQKQLAPVVCTHTTQMGGPGDD